MLRYDEGVYDVEVKFRLREATGPSNGAVIDALSSSQASWPGLLASRPTSQDSILPLMRTHACSPVGRKDSITTWPKSPAATGGGEKVSLYRAVGDAELQGNPGARFSRSILSSRLPTVCIS